MRKYREKRLGDMYKRSFWARSLPVTSRALFALGHRTCAAFPPNIKLIQKKPDLVLQNLNMGVLASFVKSHCHTVTKKIKSNWSHTSKDTPRHVMISAGLNLVWFVLFF